MLIHEYLSFDCFRDVFVFHQFGGIFLIKFSLAGCVITVFIQIYFSFNAQHVVDLIKNTHQILFLVSYKGLFAGQERGRVHFKGQA